MDVWSGRRSTARSRPRLKKAMLFFLECIFTLEEATDEAPGSVVEILQDHTEDLLDRFEDVFNSIISLDFSPFCFFLHLYPQPIPTFPTL
ncbi:hypothetical protein MHYP_G00204640 [Metynnis hypsauchen]